MAADAKANLRHGGGGPYDGDMEARVRRLEDEVTAMRGELSDLRVTATRIEERMATKPDLEKLAAEIRGAQITEWQMARVVFYVMGSLTAAAIWGPRLIAMLPEAN